MFFNISLCLKCPSSCPRTAKISFLSSFLRSVSKRTTLLLFPSPAKYALSLVSLLLASITKMPLLLKPTFFIKFSISFFSSSSFKGSNLLKKAAKNGYNILIKTITAKVNKNPINHQFLNFSIK